ncbi:MAG: OmpH family outer membrane protein [Bacteroidota bacterium]
MKKLFFFCCLLGLTLSVQAQRYGHINFSALLAQMPESAAAETELQTLNDQLVAQGEEKLQQLEASAREFQTAQASDEFSPNQLRLMAEGVEAERQELIGFEQAAAQQLESRRTELLEPVVAKAQQAVEDVALAGGFLMIFDTGIFNAVLYADESEDIMDLVKENLGIVDEEE